MQEKRSITAQDLKHALVHIRALVFGEHASYDGAGRLKEILHEEAIIFDDGDQNTIVEELHQEIEHLKHLVHKDELTGILNRRGIREEFGRFFKEALYTKDHPEHRKHVVIDDFSVIFFDDFKKINDTYGHDEGDRILKAIADVLTHHVRDIDAVGRFGGEEFVIALLGADEDHAFDKGEEIRRLISDRIALTDGAQVTVSVGVASLKHSDAEALELLIICADKAMYEAKRARGKNATVRYSELS
jgi:diguanylate cyclase (GGDEF)-like protein